MLNVGRSVAGGWVHQPSAAVINAARWKDDENKRHGKGHFRCFFIPTNVKTVKTVSDVVAEASVSLELISLGREEWRGLWRDPQAPAG